MNIFTHKSHYFVIYILTKYDMTFFKKENRNVIGILVQNKPEK